MSDAVSIARRKSTEDNAGFDALRSEAVRLIEELTGRVWTDYNLHDPGITILEQLIYAITDVVHRTDFPVADYLAGADGTIDYPQHALHPPLAVFPCRPLTELDYRKQFIDAVTELDNVWLTPLAADHSEANCGGLYILHAKLQQGLSDGEQQRVLDALRRIYAQSRNLCEDVAVVRAIGSIKYELCARIEVSSKRHPAELMAEIYFSCYRLMADTIGSEDYATALQHGAELDLVLDGPLTASGRYRDVEFGPPVLELSLADLFAQITQVEGINHIEQLSLQREGVNYYETIVTDSIETAFALQLPQTRKQIKVVLTRSHRVLPVDVDDLRAKFEELMYRHDRRVNATAEPQSLSVLPGGTARPFSSYSSIQNDFPEKYGINAYGVPESETDKVKARAVQLKSYLAIFEQFLANFMGNIDSIKTLFSLDDEQHHSYRFQSLAASNIDKLELFYPTDDSTQLEQASQLFDHYEERKGRVLDYLLALHGESFSQNSLRHFNYYYGKDEMEQVIVANKLSYLRSIVQIGRDRGAAPDHSGSSWEQRAGSGLHLKVNHLLGFVDRTARSLIMAIARHGIKLTRHDEYVHLKGGSGELRFLDIEGQDQASPMQLLAIPQLSKRGHYDLKYLLDVVGDAIPFNNGLLSDMLLRGGIKVERFRVVSLTDEQSYQLVFQATSDHYWYLGTYNDQESAFLAAHAMRELLVDMNKQSEGFHLLEHLLLRPLASNHKLSGEEQMFYSFRASAILPSWTARCHDRQFRKLAEETLRLNAPAHIHLDYYWLDFNAMYEFETLYENWQAIKCQPQAPLAELDAQSRQLVAFLANHRTKTV